MHASPRQLLAVTHGRRLHTGHGTVTHGKRLRSGHGAVTHGRRLAACGHGTVNHGKRLQSGNGTVTGGNDSGMATDATALHLNCYRAFRVYDI